MGNLLLLVLHLGKLWWFLRLRKCSPPRNKLTNNQWHLKYFEQVLPEHFLPQGCIQSRLLPLSSLLALNPFSWRFHGLGWHAGTGEQAGASSRWHGRSGAARTWFHSLWVEKAALAEKNLLQSPFPWGIWEIICDLLWQSATFCTCSGSEGLGQPLKMVKPLLFGSSHSSSSLLLVTSLWLFKKIILLPFYCLLQSYHKRSATFRSCS